MENLFDILLFWILGIPLLVYGMMLMYDLYEKNRHKIFFDIPSLSKR